MAKTSRRHKKTSRRTTRRSRPRRTSRHARRQLKGLVIYKTRRGKLWKTGRIPAGLTLRSWRKTHKGARVLGHAISFRAQQKLLKRLLKKSATRRSRRSLRSNPRRSSRRRASRSTSRRAFRPKKRFAVVDGRSYRRVFTTIGQAERAAKAGARKKPESIWTIFDQGAANPLTVVGQVRGAAHGG